MEYISIIYNFQLQNSHWISNLKLTQWDYLNISYNAQDFEPYEKPKKPLNMNMTESEEAKEIFGIPLSTQRQLEISELRKKYSEKISKWELDCIRFPKWRKFVRNYLIEILENEYKQIKGSKNNKPNTVTHYSLQYNFYVKERIDSWLDIWSNAILNNESLENLLIFEKYGEMCLDEKLVQKEIKRKALESQRAYEYFRDEGNYYNNPENSYREAGGGDEWSDSSDYY